MVIFYTNIGTRSKDAFILKEDNWDDYDFKTTFVLYHCSDNWWNKIGTVKIGRKGLKKGEPHTEIPKKFNSLSDEYFSLGSKEEYYKNLAELGEVGSIVLRALNDVIFNEKEQEIENEDSYDWSLRRDITDNLITRYRSIIKSKYNLVEYSFHYIFNPKGKNHDEYSTKELQYTVEHNSILPTRMKALIGTNGAGKTYILKGICESYCKYLLEDNKSANLIFNEESYNSSFTGITYLSSTPLDANPLDSKLLSRISEYENSRSTNYIPINILLTNNCHNEQFKNDTQPQSDSDEIKRGKIQTPSDFNTIIKLTFAKKDSRDDFLLCMIQLLHLLEESNCNLGISQSCKDIVKCYYGFNRDDDIDDKNIQSSLRNNLGSEYEKIDTSDSTYNYEELCSNLQEEFLHSSSGQKMILLLLSQVCYSIHDNYLVLLDEPENYMHPPLLSAFIRTLNSLLGRHKSMSIIATHSPIILQEMPKSCVTIYKNIEGFRLATTPKIETFGENLGTIINDIYGYDSCRSGFYQVLADLMENNKFDVEKVIKLCDNNIGSEAIAYLNIIKYENESENNK